MVGKATSKLGARLSDAENDAHVHLLDRFIRASADFPELMDSLGIVSMLMSTISGAGDTTATTITAALYNMLQCPRTLETLTTELISDGVSGIPSFAEVDKLPFLNAVIKEKTRLFAISTWPMERKVPVGGATISGVLFAEGTSVGCLPSAVHVNTDISGADDEQFRPERWLENDEEKLKVMDVRVFSDSVAGGESVWDSMWQFCR